MDPLLDTNTMIWALSRSERLGRARTMIVDPDNHVYVSVASVWEMAIKVGLGKLNIPSNLATWIPTKLADAGFMPLAIDLHDVCAVERLPRHHRDPFDRLLIAQARTRRLTIITGDSQFERYDVQLIRC